MPKWNYWNDRAYYREEMKKRALGLSPELEALKHLAELAQQYYSPGDKILDAGCGTGHFILSLEKRIGKNFIYTGVDFTKSYIQDAENIFKDKSNLNFFEGDIRDLPLPDDSYDITVCSNTIPHIPNANFALKELSRITKKVLLVRMLISNETLITKKALGDTLDENGEPQNFMYVNIYSKNYIHSALDFPPLSIEFLEDKFDPKSINKHYTEHKETAGKNVATRIIGSHQVKGNLILPWRILKVKKG